VKHQTQTELFTLKSEPQLPAAIELSASVPEALDINSPKKKPNTTSSSKSLPKRGTQRNLCKKGCFLCCLREAKMESSSSSSGGVPESTIEAVERTVANLKLVETHLLEFLSLANPDVLDEMPPLQRAQSLFMLAKATSTIFACMYI
jgi:hypothetical protein